MAGAYGPLLDALRGVRWPARRAVLRGAPGSHRSRQRGSGGEFTEYRLYRQGDDPRTLDWKLLARSDRPFVRLSDDRAVLPTWLLVDGSASMAYPGAVGEATREGSKWWCAKQLAVGLAAVVHAAGDPVGVIAVHADGVLRLPPRTRRGTIGAIADGLDGCAPGGEGALRDALAPLVAAGTGAVRLVCITDALHGAPREHEALLRVIASPQVSGALAECVHVVAATELDPPVGMHRVHDPEDRVRADDAPMRALSATTRAEYRAAFDAFRDDVAKRWRAFGAGYTEVVTRDGLTRDAQAAEMARAVRAIVRGVAVADADADVRGDARSDGART